MVLKFPVLVVLVGLGAGPLTSGGLTDSLTRDDRPQPQDWPRPKAEDRPQLHDWPRPKADDRPQAQEWPCPTAADILPCVCSVDAYFNMKIDCSTAETCEQLLSAFDTEFPFTHFQELKIDPDPSDWHGSLTTLDPNTFGVLTFERVIIRSTQLTSLHPQTFANSLATLKYLNLANNKINDFPFETVPLYSALHTLTLEENYLANLPPFESASLEVLSVSGNRKMTFNDTVFHATPSLREIYMDRLLLQNLMPGFLLNLENLTVISLEENRLTELGELTIATERESLASVNLNYNQISYLYPSALQGLARNAELTMRSNFVKTLDQETWNDIFDQVLPSGVIDLADNPLTCECDIAWIMLEENDIYRPLITKTTTCSGGESVIYLDPHYFCSHCEGYNCTSVSQ
ncbi:oplophorus-luciferin 2-monooxygenase non-catalytic subunit-like [Panulirus ornatus]|uniref:oplophorus-luciferin 2-monooxygenase non-catalytic subunit-like n=1 Tax=Panulirus ornatus TaxID=150431 RepID=UPI003A88DE6E